MTSQLKFRDARNYLHGSDIVAHVLQQVAGYEPRHLILDFQQPARSNFQLRLVSDIGLNYPRPYFKAKIITSSTALDLIGVPVDNLVSPGSIKSTFTLAEQEFSADGFKVVSNAISMADFVYDMVLAIKNHSLLHGGHAASLMIRRVVLDCPFSLPAGTVFGSLRRLKMGAQSWSITCALQPNVKLILTGLYAR